MLCVCADNDYEIGEEPEFVWGKFHGKPKRRHRPGGKWKKSKADSEGISGWLTKRNKLGNMIEHCSDILKRVGQVESGCEVIMAKQDDTPEVQCSCVVKGRQDAVSCAGD